MLLSKTLIDKRCCFNARSRDTKPRARPLSQWPGVAAERTPAGWQIRSQAVPEPQEPQDFEGLLPEEDQEVPGTYWDALNGNTKLGKAVRAACEELEHLNELEMGVLHECDVLLKKLGMKGSLFQTSSAAMTQQQQQQQEPEQQQQEEQQETAQ